MLYCYRFHFKSQSDYISASQVLGHYLKTYDLEAIIAVSLPREHEDDHYLGPGDLGNCSSHDFEYVEGMLHSVPSRMDLISSGRVPC